MKIFRIIAIILATQTLFAKFEFYNKYKDIYAAETNLMINYPNAIERLVYYKNDNLKVFYGGPINSTNNTERPYSPRWMMPIMFEENSKTTAVMDVIFINCTPDTANDADVIVTTMDDLRLKLRLIDDKEYQVVHSILYPQTNQKRVLIRICDFANIYYPDIYINNGKISKDYIKTLVKYLHETFNTKKTYQVLGLVSTKSLGIQKETDEAVIYEPTIYELYGNKVSIQKIILKKDVWKMYYVIKNTEVKDLCSMTLRIDSGCVSGQIYDDDACDCYDQFKMSLTTVAHDKDALIIHIPGQDGRGFGTAPKAETEIYKRGGKGRVHTTKPLDTVEAAKLLYGEGIYDLRTYDGIAKILNILHIKQLKLITDNVIKLETLKEHGFQVTRVKTHTEKETCKEHIKAKHNSPLYYKED